MKFWNFAARCAAALLAFSTHFASAANSPPEDEQEIRALQTRLAAAVSARDLDSVMKEYVRGNELFVFDSDLPRQHTGWDTFKKDWGNFVNSADNVTDEVENLGITVEGNAAFSHHLAHLVWTGKK